ncbi:MAG: DUF4388 domain-containing protein, partial [Polyangiaceae bacterium]
PWVLYTASADDALVEFMRELDVADVISKASGPDALASAITERLEEKGIRPASARPVQGSLADCGVAEIAELLAAGRKTCGMQLRGQHAEGVIVFEDGHVVDARLVPTGAPAPQISGEEAFYGLVAVKDGPFVIGAVQVTDRTIFDASTAALVAEGLRRLP